MKGMETRAKLVAAGIGAGAVAIILAMMGNPANMAICVACFIRDMAGAMKFHSAAVVQYARPEIVGIVIGACMVSLMTKEFRSSAGSSPMLRFLLGMAIMIGSLIFLGCPLRMVIRMAAGDMNAYVALIGFVLGVGSGTFALKKGFSLGRAYETRAASGMVLPVVMAGVLVLSVGTGLFAVSEKGPGSMHAPVIISLIGGLAFGILAQRSRMCFAGGIRDVILMKNFDLFSVIGGLFAAMLLYNLISGSFHLSFAGQPVAHTEHIWNAAGMYVVGFAAVLAGGCPLRQLVLAGQGSSDAAVTFLGLFVGAAVCHNFGLASSGDGTTPNGRIACLICIAVVAGIAINGCRRKK